MSDEFNEDMGDVQDSFDTSASEMSSEVEDTTSEDIELDEECYGHGGDDMDTYDSYASYPESHFSETDEQYMDEHAEATEATNERAQRELEEFQRLQDEEAELEEAEAETEQIESEAEQEALELEEQDTETQHQTEMVEEEQKEQERIAFENISDDELREKYEGIRAHDAALGDQYTKYDEQIAELSRDKSYYSESEWNNYIDEKIKAQDDVSSRRYQIQSEMRAMESEIDRRKE